MTKLPTQSIVNLMGALQLLQIFSDYLSAIPSGLWTFLAALAALFGISFQLRAHRHREQLQRTAELRQNIFLAACEAISRSQEYIRRNWSPSLSDADLYNLIKDFPPAIVKIHAVGGIKTIEILCEYEDSLNKAALAVADDRLDVSVLQIEQDAAFSLVEHFQKIRSEFANNHDVEASSKVTAELEQLTKRAHSAMAAKRKRAFTAIRQSTALGDTLAEISTRLVQEIRRELEFDPLATDVYTRLIEPSLRQRAIDFSDHIDKSEKRQDPCQLT